MNGIIYNIAISLPGFLMAIVFHEWAHAYIAHRYGDDTAKMQGRLTFNPSAHYDLVGTVIFPLFGAIIGGIMFGWAKPVPVDPRRFKNMKSGIFWVSFAGPLANMIIAVFSAFMFAAFIHYLPNTFEFKQVLMAMARQALIINLVIAVFNLIPFPPLDGSKMVSTFLDYESARKYENLAQYSFIFIIILWTTNIFSYLMSPALRMGQGMLNFFINILG
tara:strand:- start:62853 stop:63506 length:654 start_codon:yes stop_codon:yes gene_type:complete